MKNSKKISVTKLTLAALFLSLALVLPIFTAQLKEVGDTLLPMHLPVMLCGLICGWKYGFSVGLITPFLRFVIFGMPPIYPSAIYMALELATYGLVIGLLFKRKNLLCLYISIISSQLAGRIVWGISKALLLGVADKPFGIEAFLIGGFADALPGIILQLVLIPLIMTAINKASKSKRT